jgi:hypothetical protein
LSYLLSPQAKTEPLTAMEVVLMKSPVVSVESGAKGVEIVGLGHEI